SWKYLGWEITKATVRPQQIDIRTEVSTLNDVQKLLGDLNWIRTMCGLTNTDLAPLI
ncbi:POK18 protein, partial [Himantopus himantopus]|nr:POK18 protein [Himantopus himantopus]